MDTVATSLADDEEWELYNDDGFVYKRKKRRLNPDEAALAAAAAAARPLSMDPEAEERNRRERKRKTLLKLKERYQREIDRWELLSNTLRAMEERARQRQEHEDTPSLSALPLSSPEIVNGSLVDELLLQVEAQEAIIRDVSNLCDVAEAMCNAQEEQMKQSFIDLPIWASPHELIASLCVD